jgi:glyoxylase-like metal-dependent hydrolase (beta-lactamase superfamily II)
VTVAFQALRNAITAHLAATFAGLPVYVHTIEHADGVVLVDTGMLDSTPELDEEGAPVPMPENIPRDVVCVINTHLPFDHCGGNRLFPGVPIHVQRLELQRLMTHTNGSTSRVRTTSSTSKHGVPRRPETMEV